MLYSWERLECQNQLKISSEYTLFHFAMDDPVVCVPTIRPFLLLVFREIEGHKQGHGLRRKTF